MRVLVTGGAGFIGTALARAGAQEADEWVVLDNLLTQVHGPDPQLDLPGSVRLVVGDVRDPEAIHRVVREAQPDVVVHLAAETGTGQSLTEPSRHADVNVTGTARLLEALDANPDVTRRVILTSSRAVYGEGHWLDRQGRLSSPAGRTLEMLEAGQWDFPGLRPLPSTAGVTPPRPCNVYGATKLAQEHLLQSWAVARSACTAVLRLQNVYGPGQSPLNPYTGITTLFFGVATAGSPIPVYEDGLIGRDFVFIRDVVDALRAALADEGDSLLDVGSGTVSTIAEVAAEISRLADGPEPVVTGQYRLGDVRHASCVAPRAEPSAGGRATPLSEGLAALHRWLRDSPADSSASVVG